MAAIPLKLCEYNKATKTLLLASEYWGGGFPNEVDIKSHHTGKTVHFVRVDEHSPFWDQDGWDGEQMVYVPTEPVPNVVKMAVYHQW